jgi:hypothetical protein
MQDTVQRVASTLGLRGNPNWKNPFTFADGTQHWVRTIKPDLSLKCNIRRSGAFEMFVWQKLDTQDGGILLRISVQDGEATADEVREGACLPAHYIAVAEALRPVVDARNIHIPLSQGRVALASLVAS